MEKYINTQSFDDDDDAHDPPGQQLIYDDDDAHDPPGQQLVYDDDDAHDPPGQQLMMMLMIRSTTDI